MVQAVAESQQSSELEPEPESASEATESLEEPELELEMDLPVLEQPEAKDQMLVQSESPVKLTATAIVEEQPQLKVEAIDTSQTTADDDAEDEVPQMWRIDAPDTDIDSIYQEEEKIIEVEFEDTFNVSEVAVDLDNIHQQAPEVIPELSGVSSPELHPARAMEVNTNGSPELEDYLTNGFDCMAKEDWDQAARNFQRLAQQIPSDAAVLNNYGLALLQKAIQMEGSSDASTVSLSATQYESAIMALRQAAKIDPAKNDLILNLSHALLVSGRNEKSLGIVKVFRERQPSDVEGINIEAAALLQLGRFDEARRLFSAAVDDPLVKANLERVPSPLA
jgi:tetratricopeptide (TPR) repeat protein